MTSLFSSLFRRSEKRRTYADLMQLDDHLLRDIGIARSDLHLIASGRRSHTKGFRAHE